VKRRWLLWLVILVALVVIVARLAEIENLFRTLVQGRWEWVVAAGLTMLMHYVAYTEVYQSAFYAVDVRRRLIELLPVTFAAAFLNVIVPVAGVSGTALFVDDAAQRGKPPSRTAAGAILVLAADFTAFTAILVAGLIYLSSQGQLQIYQVGGASVMLLMTAALVSLLLLALWAEARLWAVFRWVQGAINRVGGWFQRPELLAKDWAEENAAEFSQAAKAISAFPGRLGRTFAVALGSRLIHMAGLYILFLAFYQPVAVGTLWAGYAVGVNFWIVSLTPQGVGVVESVMVLVYQSLDVPAAPAAAVTLAFRGLSLWLPVGIGFLMLRSVRSFNDDEDVEGAS